MENYLNLAKYVLDHGDRRSERTGTGTLSVFGPQLEFDLRKGFPAVTTKRLNMHLVWTELLWMISGSSSLAPLIEAGNNIWNEWPFKKWVDATGYDLDITDQNSERYKTAMAWFKHNVVTDPDFADKWGHLGPVYGVQWRQWKKGSRIIEQDDTSTYINLEWVDQLQQAIDKIKSNPTDRRILITAWNPGELDEMVLPPCHMFYQLYVEGEYLDIKVYQRSADVFLGLPFDIASYATLATMIGHITGKTPRMLYYTLGDTHIYLNHVEQMNIQVAREPYPLPYLSVNVRDRWITNINDFTIDDLELTGYQHHKVLKGSVSI